MKFNVANVSKNVIAMGSQVLAIKVSLKLSIDTIGYDESCHTNLCKDVFGAQQYFLNEVLTSNSVYNSQLWNTNFEKFRTSGCVCCM